MKNITLFSRFYVEDFEKFKQTYNLFKNVTYVLNTVDFFKFYWFKSTSIRLNSYEFGIIVVPVKAGVGYGVAIVNN